MKRIDVRRGLRVAIGVGVAGLVLNAAFYGFFVRPRIRAYQDLVGAKRGFERELAQAQKTRDDLAAYAEKLARTEKNTEVFFAQVLGKKLEKSIEIQEEIADIGAEFRINPESVSYQNADLTDDGLEKFAIEIPVVGDYSDLRKFIARIENSPRFLVVDRISLAGSKEGGLQLSLSISVSTYFHAPWLKELSGPVRGKGTRRRA